MFMLTCLRNNIPPLLGTLHLPFSTFYFLEVGPSSSLKEFNKNVIDSFYTSLQMFNEKKLEIG